MTHPTMETCQSNRGMACDLAWRQAEADWRKQTGVRPAICDSQLAAKSEFRAQDSEEFEAQVFN